MFGIFEKRSLKLHIRNLKIQLTNQVNELLDIIHEYKTIANYLYNHSTEFDYMKCFISGFSIRSSSIVDNYNLIHNKEINLKNKSKKYLNYIIDDLNYALRLIEKEKEEVIIIYDNKLKDHFNYVSSYI